MSDLVGNPNCWFSHAQAQVCFSYFTGFHYWTYGQRARIAAGQTPYFIAKKDQETNDILVVCDV